MLDQASIMLKTLCLLRRRNPQQHALVDSQLLAERQAERSQRGRLLREDGLELVGPDGTCPKDPGKTGRWKGRWVSLWAEFDSPERAAGERDVLESLVRPGFADPSCSCEGWSVVVEMLKDERELEMGREEMKAPAGRQGESAASERVARSTSSSGRDVRVRACQGARVWCCLYLSKPW